MTAASPPFGPARPDAWVAVVLLAVAVATFPGVLDPGLVFYQRDVASYWYPHVATLKQVIAAGSWPTWDPYEGFGLPLATPDAELWYPPTLLLALLSPAVYFKLFVVAHCWWSGLGVQRLARAWGLEARAALVAALAWQLAGPFVSLASVWHHYASAAWMPWTLLALERVLERATPRRVAALAAAAALQALAGSADLCFMTALLGAGRLLSDPRRNLRRLPALAGAGALAAALAAAQWWPTALQLASSSRARMAGLNLYWSLHPWSLLDVLVCRLVADMPMTQPVRGVLFEGREPFLGTLYLGPVVLGLAVTGLVAGLRTRWAAVTAVLFVGLALGSHGPLRDVLQLPPFSVFRYPVKYLVPAALLLSLLAGAGAEAWLQPLERRSRRGIVAAALVLLALAAALTGGASWIARHPDAALALLEGPVPAGVSAETALLAPVFRRGILGAVLAGATALLFAVRARRPEAAATATVVAGLVFVGSGLPAARSINTLAPANVVAAPALPAGLGDAQRILALPVSSVDVNRRLQARPGWSREATYIRRALDCFAPVSPARVGVRGSYDGDPTFLGPPLLMEASSVAVNHVGSTVGLHLLQIGAVDLVVDCGERPLPEPYEVASTGPAVGGGEIRFLRVPGTLPRVRAVGRVRPARDNDEAWAILADPSFDPRTEAVTVGGPPLAATSIPVTEVLLDRPDRLRVRVTGSSAGLLVVGSAHAKGWQARLDTEQAVPVEVVNLLFQGVRVPAGTHEVELLFRPAGARAGALASAVALLAVLVLARRRTFDETSSGAVASAAR